MARWEGCSVSPTRKQRLERESVVAFTFCFCSDGMFEDMESVCKYTSELICFGTRNKSCSLFTQDPNLAGQCVR